MMHPIFRSTITPFLCLICCCLAAYFLFINQDSPSYDSIQGSTWSVVAVDVESGEVGVAAASCVPILIDGLAALVPGKGAAATQAWFSMGNRNHVFERLQEGQSAQAIIDSVTDVTNDEDADQRQYGIITIHDGTIEAAGFTGAKNEAWAGDLQDLSAAVSVQGNILEGDAVVNEALAAFKDDSLGPVVLSDRLIRALEAGSAAGGDKRCNQDGIQQTAQAAFIMVSQPDQGPFAAEEMGLDGSGDANAPQLYLSVLEPERGANPLIALRQQYDEWRRNNLNACGECNLSAISVPAGGLNTNSAAGQRAQQHQQSTIGFMVVLGLLIGGLVLAVVRAKMRERQAAQDK